MKIEKLIEKIDKGYYAIGEGNNKCYSIAINDVKEGNGKKYILNISTMRSLLLQSVFFDTAEEIADHLDNVNLKLEKDI